MKELERKYLISLLIVFVFLVVMAIASFVYASIIIYQQNSITNNILELFYMGVHIVALVLGIYFVVQALKSPKGSYIMKSLSLDESFRRANKVVRIIAIVFSSFGFIIGLYFTLVLCKVPLPYFNFPIALILDLINSPFSLFVLGMYFIFYPVIYLKSKKKE